MIVVAAAGVLAAPSAAAADPIHQAAVAGNVFVVKYLLLRDPNLVRSKGLDDWTPLHYAACCGNLEVLRVLIAHKADVDAPSIFGTPLQLAVQSGYLDAGEFLLKAGAKLDVWTAAGLGKTDELKRILDRDPKLLAAEGPLQSQVPLHWAAKNGQSTAVDLLLKRGAKVSAREGGDTPLHLACKGGHERVVKLLLAYKADMRAKSNCDQTPLAYAIVNDRSAVVKLLLESGAEVNGVQYETNFRGGAFGQVYSYTPLHLAAERGNKEIIQLLLLHKADHRAPGQPFGITPLDSWRGSPRNPIFTIDLICWKIQYETRGTWNRLAKYIQHAPNHPSR
jgi:ankyrin repeat protein